MSHRFPTLLGSLLVFACTAGTAKAGLRPRIRPRFRVRARADAPINVNAGARASGATRTRARVDAPPPPPPRAPGADAPPRPARADLDSADAAARRAQLDADAAAQRAAAARTQAADLRREADFGLFPDQQKRQFADFELDANGRVRNGRFEHVTRNSDGSATRHVVEVRDGKSQVVEGNPAVVNREYGNFKAQLAEVGAYRNANTGRLVADQTYNGNPNVGYRNVQVFDRAGNPVQTLGRQVDRVGGVLPNERIRGILPREFLDGTNWPPLRQGLQGSPGGVFGI